jgi:integrase/recombinase XerD
VAKVTLYLRFETSRGERSFARPVASNGKPLTDTGIPKPLYAFVNGRAEHHPEGQYFLRYRQNGKRTWENVGSDCWVALDKKAWRERFLRDQERGAAPAGAFLSSLTHIPLVDAVERYTARVKAMKAKRTGETYSCALNGFLNSCSKAYLDEVRADDLENFQVRLRSQGQSDRTAANRVGRVVTFLRKHGIQNVTIRPGYLRKKVLPYSEEDLRCLFEASTGDERLLFSFFLGTGAREQEATFATFGDIDFENKLFLVRANPFGPEPCPSDVVRFVSILSKAGGVRASLPVAFPSDAEWLVRVMASQGQFVFGTYRRHMKTIGYLGQIDKLYGVPATTRNWNTIVAILRILKSQKNTR